MRESPSLRLQVLLGALLFAAYTAISGATSAQEYVSRTQTGPSLDEYLKQVGPDGKLISHGQLTLDGKSVNCGKRPTVLNPNFDSWGGAFPGFLILNNKKISGLSTHVKLYIYSHECGHQFVGADETNRLKRYVFIPIDLNTATDEQILSIPGIAKRMVGEFKEYRPWKTREQFMKEIGKYVGEKEAARLWRYVVIN